MHHTVHCPYFSVHQHIAFGPCFLLQLVKFKASNQTWGRVLVVAGLNTLVEIEGVQISVPRENIRGDFTQDRAWQVLQACEYRTDRALAIVSSHEFDWSASEWFTLPSESSSHGLRPLTARCNDWSAEQVKVRSASVVL